jgi:hypothetical protein
VQKLGSLLTFLIILAGCQTSFAVKPEQPVLIPLLKNTPNECYFLDEFMPTPDGVVSGKTGALSLRYYTYKMANYKEWQHKHVILSFYSKDDRCWSLFEEFYVRD